MNDQNILITFPEALTWFPLIAGLICFIISRERLARDWALLSSIITLFISMASIVYADNKEYNFQHWVWLPNLGSALLFKLDGLSRILTLLTAITYPLILVSSYNRKFKSAGTFYGLMLLMQSGVMGVFCSQDALLFYFFWELALVPAYFLSSRWGGEKRIQATFKFFVYTFAGSLLMLVGIIYLYMHTNMGENASSGFHSFSLTAFQRISLLPGKQEAVFWLFFIAVAIKMPVFPFHTWQPLAYEQAPAPVTQVLSGIMVKMGLFAVIRWILPVFPHQIIKVDNIVIGLSVIGMIYASCLAIVQNSLKRLVAYSSIAHIGLMCAAAFTNKDIALQGLMVQMFNHGINIIGLWLVVDMIERKTGTVKIDRLGGLAHKAPVLTILLVIIALANIALPLTNAFTGEFMMFAGLFQWNKWYAALAGVSVILAAVYTLSMIRKVFYGEWKETGMDVTDISLNEKIILSVIAVSIFMTGLFPQPLIELTKDAVQAVIAK